MRIQKSAVGGDENLPLNNLLDMEENLPSIKQGLEAKLDALVMRDLYSKYKTAPTEEEREQARKEYLDKRGVPEKFRW